MRISSTKLQLKASLFAVFFSFFYALSVAKKQEIPENGIPCLKKFSVLSVKGFVPVFPHGFVAEGTDLFGDLLRGA